MASSNIDGAAVHLVRREEVAVVEDKRSEAPEAAPARGERGGAGGVLDGEAGDDVAEEVVVEGADAVLAVVARRGGEGGDPAPVDGVTTGVPLQDMQDGGGHGGEGFGLVLAGAERSGVERSSRLVEWRRDGVFVCCGVQV